MHVDRLLLHEIFHASAVEAGAHFAHWIVNRMLRDQDLLFISVIGQKNTLFLGTREVTQITERSSNMYLSRCTLKYGLLGYPGFGASSLSNIAQVRSSVHFGSAHSNAVLCV